MKPGSIAIIGAGLGGLAAAIALLRDGWRVRVYEQAPVLAEVGAGITVSPGIGRALASFGLGPALLAASLPVSNVAFAHYRTGALLAGAFDHGRPAERGFETGRHIHRADLHAVLLAAVRDADPDCVMTGKRLTRIHGHAGIFADGDRATSDLLIGADGARSAVRRHLFQDGEPHFAGQVAFRCLIPATIAAPFLGAGNAVVTVGPGRIFHRYLIRGGTLLNVIGIAQNEHWRGEGWSTPASTEEFAAAFEDFNPDVQSLIRVAPAESLIKWALYIRPPLPLWRLGRVLLLGDAAHPILPFLGLGAALAMEDGVMLARALAGAPSIEAALAAFQPARHARVEDVRLRTIRQGEIIQSTDPDRPDLSRSPSQDPALFAYDPCTAPIVFS